MERASDPARASILLNLAKTRGFLTVTKTGPTFHVVLIEPKIPQNTGAIARLCAATRARLHLVGRLGFHLDSSTVKRAGVDYWDLASIEEHVDWPSCLARLDSAPVYYFTKSARRCFWDDVAPIGSIFVFGSETDGLPRSMLLDADRCRSLPMLESRVRSLNLATAVGIVLYEAIRQNRSTLLGDPAC